MTSRLQAFAGVSDAVRADRYLSPHLRHYVREVRVVVYTQVRHSIRPCEATPGPVDCISRTIGARANRGR